MNHIMIYVDGTLVAERIAETIDELLGLIIEKVCENKYSLISVSVSKKLRENMIEP